MRTRWHPRRSVLMSLDYNTLMRKEWLKQRISVAEAESGHMCSSPRLGPSPAAFGFQKARLRELVAKMQDADELWTFSSRVGRSSSAVADDASWPRVAQRERLDWLLIYQLPPCSENRAGIAPLFHGL